MLVTVDSVSELVSFQGWEFCLIFSIQNNVTWRHSKNSQSENQITRNQLSRNFAWYLKNNICRFCLLFFSVRPNNLFRTQKIFSVIFYKLSKPDTSFNFFQVSIWLVLWFQTKIISSKIKMKQNNHPWIEQKSSKWNIEWDRRLLRLIWMKTPMKRLLT